MTNKIEFFYTGGGITLAEAVVDADHYAVVSTDAPDFLAVYRYDDGESTYLPDDMVVSAAKADIPLELQNLYKEMLDRLKTA
jgi:hypothetical protein